MFFKKIMIITALISGFCSINTYAKTDISAVIKQQIEDNNVQKQANNSATGVKTESETISVVEEFLANKNQNNVIEIAKAEPVQEEGVSESEPEPIEEKEEIIENNGGLTPDGNFTLVDDISENKSDGDDEKSTDFMTVVTKNGNYLYLVIDKKNGSENVHLLNMVDESDLMSLITGEPVTYELPKQEEVTETPPPIVEEAVEEVPIETEKSNLNLVIGLLALSGLGFYAYKNWFKKDEIEGDEYEYEEEFNDNFETEDFNFSDENFDTLLEEDE